MVHYQESKIYKIIDNTNGNVFISSTCEPNLARRLAEHVSKYRRYKQGNYNYVSSFEILKNENYSIVLLENYPCNNKDELRARTRFHIDNEEQCINLHMPIRHEFEIKDVRREQKHQFYLEHKEIYKQNYELNKEHLKEQFKERYDKNKDIEVVCECGCVFDKNVNLKRHKLTKKHINLMADKEQNGNV